jgi:hypothetical protein
MTDRFKIGDIVFISNWFHDQPKNTVVRAKVIKKLDKTLYYGKYAVIIDGNTKESHIGDFGSHDVWGARIFKNSKKKIYKKEGE